MQKGILAINSVDQIMAVLHKSAKNMGARNWYFSVMIGVSRGDSLASESDGYSQSLNEYKYRQLGKSSISLQTFVCDSTFRKRGPL